MSDRKNVNMYFPPDFDPTKGSINKQQGQHPLRDRARKLDQGILIVRFELPYNIWCLGCNKMVGIGVRYNAEKKKVGNYYTTPILSFRFKCHLCDNWMEMQTDPKNTAYVCVSGCRQKIETWEAEEGEMTLDSKEEREKLAENGMYRLERGKDDKETAKLIAPTLSNIKDYVDNRSDTYSMNSKARDLMRKRRHKVKNAIAEDMRMQAKLQVNMPILPESLEDIKEARLTWARRKGVDTDSASRREAIASQGIFGSVPTTRQTVQSALLGLQKKHKQKVGQRTQITSSTLAGLVKVRKKEDK
eukprot:CFRG4198T1